MIEEKEISILGLKTNYKIGGKGFPLLILHGWNGSSDSWRKVIENLDNDFQVICPDFPGFGKSETPKIAWNLDDFVNWLRNLVDFLNLEKFFLLGHSFGGRVAIKFSICFQEKVKALILANSAGIKQNLDFKGWIIFQLSKIGNVLFSPKILFRFKDWARNFFYQIFRIKDWAKAKGVMRETMKKVIEEDLLSELEKIKIKTLIIWGEKDKIIPLKYANIFREKIKNSDLKILSKTHHSPHLEKPEILAKVIRNFLLTI